MIHVEYAVTCQAKPSCGILGEHMESRASDLLTGKHVRDTKHPTSQVGIPVQPSAKGPVA